jgi:phenylacetate-CoA ligase
MMSNIGGMVHDRISSNILLPLMQLQQSIRPARSAVNKAFREGMAFRTLTARWSEDEKREWVLRRLRFSVRRAFLETTYYRDLFRKIGFDPREDFNYDDFAHIPVLDRDTIHQQGSALITNTIPMNRLRKDATGGSTGVPTEIWRGAEEEGWSNSGQEYFMGQVGLPTGSRVAMLWGHHLDPVANDRLKDRLCAYAHNFRWFDCFRLSPERLERYHHEFERFRPAGIVAYASAIGHLAEHVLDRSHNPRYPRCSIVTGAEKLLPAHRETIEAAFKRSPHERYGARDAGLIGIQLEPHKTLTYSIDWSNIFVEPETNEPESAVLITKLHGDGMPMIRYRIGDVARFAKGSRPGYPCFILQDVIGRVTDRVWLPTGQWISGIQFPHLLKDYPVREFMLLQRADYSVRLLIVPKDSFSEPSRRGIEKTVVANLPGLDVRVEVVGDIPRTKSNKWRPVVTEVVEKENVCPLPSR